MDAIEKTMKVYSIKIEGNKKDKADAFYILMTTTQINSNSKNIYHGLKYLTLQLLKDAEIKFEILKTSQ